MKPLTKKQKEKLYDKRTADSGFVETAVVGWAMYGDAKGPPENEVEEHVWAGGPPRPLGDRLGFGELLGGGGAVR